MSLTEGAEAVLALLATTGERLSIKALSARMPELSHTAGAVEELLREGLIWHGGKGRYAVLDVLGMDRGRVRVRADGSAVVFASGSLRVQIPPGDIQGALDGDTVLVRLTEPDLHRNGYRGIVVHILKRFRTHMAGIIRKRSGRLFLDPLNPVLPGNVPVKATDDSYRQGDLVGCRIIYGKRSITVEPVEKVGSPDSPGALIDSVCIDNGLKRGFPEDVAAAAELASAERDTLDSRRDLTALYTLTVDPVDARDFDDAISIERTPEGGFRLGVHIADVSAFAPPGSPVDLEAWNRGTSVYLPDRVIPMIPEVLSNGACSLLPGEERLTKTVLLDYDSRGGRKSFSVFSSRIRSRKRLCYEEALDIMSNGTDEDPELNAAFGAFGELSSLLDQERKKRGSVDLGASEFRTEFDDLGMPCGFRAMEDDMAHRMIENFMVEANSAVAEYCGWIGAEVLYRAHGDPADEASDKLRRTLSLYGISLGGHGSPHASALSAAVLEAEGSPVHSLVREAVLRSMQRAVYSPDNTGHYGLALHNYMHFTSPIRRYPDLMVHQAITAYEKGLSLKRSFSIGEAAESCSTLERRAEQAERSATELMALLYLSRHVNRVFRGVIRDAADFGLFVRLLDVPVEGLVHISAVKRDPSLLPSSRVPGTPVTVAVERVSILERKLSLIPAESPEERTDD